MAGRKSPTFTEVELEFMQIIWDSEVVSAEDIQKELRLRNRELADGSVRKILSILMKKGHLERERCGRSYQYHARVKKEQSKKNMLRDLLDRAFNGSVPGMLATLLNSEAIDADDLAEIKQLISEHEKGDKNDLPR